MGPAAFYATPGVAGPTKSKRHKFALRGPPFDERREGAGPTRNLEPIGQVDGADQLLMTRNRKAVGHSGNEVPDRPQPMHGILVAAPAVRKL